MISVGEYLMSSIRNEEIDSFCKMIMEEKSIKYEGLLLCGGAYGHMSHPYEDLSLSFSDIRDIINSVLSGNIQAYEKTDGQNLMITWKDGQVKAARNKGHLKNNGEKSLTKDELNQMFMDRPPQVREAFYYAMDDLEKALSKVNPQLLERIFQNGKRFMSVEVILPETQNVIPYGLNMLVFHGAIEYDENGNPTGRMMIKTGQFLENIIKKVNANVQNHFTIRGQNKIALQHLSELQKKRSEYLSLLKKIQNGFADSNTIGDYHTKIWSDMIKNKSSEMGYNIPENILNFLVQRWVGGDKSTPINKIIKLIDNEKFKTWVKNFDGKPSKEFFTKVNEPFENLFLKFGTDILANASGYLSSSPNNAAKQIAKNIESEIEKIKSSNDIEAMSKLKDQLERIQKSGGLEKITGTEGIQFYKNGKIYKLTGLFAPINQILGLLRYKK